VTARSHRPTIVHDGTGWHVSCSCGTRTENLATHEEAQAAWREHLPPAESADVAEALIAATPPFEPHQTHDAAESENSGGVPNTRSAPHARHTR